MKELLMLIMRNNILTLASSDFENVRASAMEYVVVNNQIVIGTNQDSIKAKNISKNNRISVSIVDMPQFVTIDGMAVSPTEHEINQYNEILFGRHPELNDVVGKAVIKNFVYYKLIIKKAYYNDYARGMSPTEIIEV